MKKIIRQHHENTSPAFQKSALRLWGRVFFLFALLTSALPGKLFAQAPSISYNGPQNFVLNTAAPSLSPANNGGSVSAPGYSSIPISVFSGTGYSNAFVFDASGNIYTFDYSNSSNRKLVKLTPTGTNPVTLISFLSRPEDITIDASGNVYALDGGYLYKITPGGTVSTVQSFSGSPTGVAVDAAGNLYVSTYSAGITSIIEVPAGGGGNVNIGSGLSYMTDVAVDAAGNLYVCNDGDASIKKIAAGTGTVTTIASGFTQYSTADLSQITVDPTGNIFFSEANGARVSEIPAGSNTPIQIGSGFFAPGGLVLDATGDLFVIDNGALKEIKPVGGYYISPSLPAGLSFDNSTGIISGTPTVTSAATDYKVTASNSSGSASATINITVSSSVSTDDKLSNLAISYGAFSPSFSPSIFSYAEEVPNSVSSVTLTITADLANETIKTYGGIVPSGGTSIPVPLAPGVNTVFIQVFAQDGVSKNIYSVAITRDTASTDASLSNIQMSAGTLAPVFSPATTNYRVTVGNSFSSITLMPTTTDPGATVKVNGTLVTSGSASTPIALKVGRDTITTTVKAQDGTTTKTYTVVVIRKANVNLISLKTDHSGLIPSFSPATTAYSTTVGLGTSSIVITPTVADLSDTIRVNGTQVASGSASPAIPLTIGANAVTILVKALDGTTKTYTLTVNRQADLDVINILLSHTKVTPVFSRTTTSYTATVGTGVTSTAETPILADATNTVTVNGVIVPSGTASGPITLAYGSNIITTLVTAADGTTRTYTVNVIRPTIANLKSLALSSGTLSPVFSPATTGYTASVDNAVSSITVTPVTAGSQATVTVNGTPVASGTASGNVDLSVGENAINIAVTGKDGILTKIYTVDVTRAAGSLNTVYQPISVSNPTDHPQMMGAEIAVHQGLSPNGDGINDFLLIDGITQYPDNKLQIMNRSGQLVYEAKGYDNSTKVFDGHSNKNGALQLPGTYFYSLDVTANGVTQHKTGFIVLKY